VERARTWNRTFRRRHWPGVVSALVALGAVLLPTRGTLYNMREMASFYLFEEDGKILRWWTFDPEPIELYNAPLSN
jgi:hypothetical protein